MERQRLVFIRHHPYRLRGIIDNDVDIGELLIDIVGKPFNSLDLAEIQPVNMNAILPMSEIGFLDITVQGIIRKTGR
ncbi:hypothetical protein D1872_298250 [compost metagenome]